MKIRKKMEASKPPLKEHLPLNQRFEVGVCAFGVTPMKRVRQKKILQLITEKEIETQEELQKILERQGFPVTQATVSRDIREMGLIKIASSSGGQKYGINAEKDQAEVSLKFAGILTQAALSAQNAGNLLVIKTYTGMASAAGAAVDSMQLEKVIGSIAGDDTLLIITTDNQAAEELCEKFNRLFG